MTDPVVSEPSPVWEAERLLVESPAVRALRLNEMETETLALSTVRLAESVTVHFHTELSDEGAVPESVHETVAAVLELMVMVSPLTFVHE